MQLWYPVVDSSREWSRPGESNSSDPMGWTGPTDWPFVPDPVCRIGPFWLPHALYTLDRPCLLPAVHKARAGAGVHYM